MSGTGTSLVGSGFRPIPQDSAPAAWTLGRVGLWTAKTGPTAGHPIWRMPDGSDLDLSASSGGGLPDQSGHGGQFLTTNGTSANWATVDPTLGGDLSGTASAATVVAIQTIPVEAMDGFVGPAPTNNQALVYNSAVGHTQFEPTNIVNSIRGVSGVLVNGVSGGLAQTGASITVGIDVSANNFWTGSQNFAAGTLRVQSSGSTTTLASAATGPRTWTFPDATDTAVGTLGATMSGPFAFFGTQIGTYTLGGTPTLGASLTISGGVNMTASSGAGAFDFSAATGLFKTSTGANQLSGLTTIAPGAVSSGTPTALTLTLPANTGLNTTAEVTSVNINLAANTQTWAAGTIPNQRFVRIQAPTIAFASASTATVATTFEIGGAPAQGTNATITTALALRVASGASRFDGNVSINAMPSQAYNLAVTGTNSGNDLVFLENNDNTKYTSIAFADSAGTVQIAMGWANSTVADTVVRSTFQIFSGTNDLNIGNRGSSNISMTVKGTGKIGVNNQSPGAYLDVKSGDADSSTAKAMIINTSTTWSSNNADLITAQTNGAVKFAVRNLVGGGGWSAALAIGGGFFDTTLNVGTRLVSTSQLDLWAASSAKITMSTAALSSSADFGMTLGTSSLRYGETWSRRYLGVEQTIAGAATFVIDPALGNMVRVTLNATTINAGGITAGTFKAGEQIVIEFIQDATGGRTLTQANFSSTFVFAGGTYTVSSGANKRDIFVGVWDNTTAKLYMTPAGVNF